MVYGEPENTSEAPEYIFPFIPLLSCSLVFVIHVDSKLHVWVFDFNSNYREFDFSVVICVPEIQTTPQKGGSNEIIAEHMALTYICLVLF